MDELTLKLVDPAPGLVAAWQARFEQLANVEIAEGCFEEIEEYDCMVSPANSFGLMDGGVDGAITRYFGVQLMRRVQARVLDEFLGEQPIGTCIIVETGHKRHPFLAHTPTMRVPMSISRTDSVYYAMWAMLLAVRAHNARSDRKIGTVLCPGLGTGHGHVPYDEAARQMALAYRHFLNPPDRINWQFAASRQDAIRRGGDLGLLTSTAPRVA